MKRFKELSFAIVAAVAVIGFSAFKINEGKTSDQPSYKYYHLAPGGNAANANDYSLANGNGNSPATDCPTGTVEVCSIFAQPSSTNPGKPDLSYIDADETIYRAKTNP